MSRSVVMSGFVVLVLVVINYNYFNLSALLMVRGYSRRDNGFPIMKVQILLPLSVFFMCMSFYGFSTHKVLMLWTFVGF